jgi:ubiquinone/menaquinone biosynthesis C-methylase UbiE
MALFFRPKKIKYVFSSICFFYCFQGKNLPLLTDFFFEYIPLYDKFRAVSSIQVVLELCFPVLGYNGIAIVFHQIKKSQWKSLYETILFFGILLILFFKQKHVQFSGGTDAYFQESYGPDFVNALKEDRMSLFN